MLILAGALVFSLQPVEAISEPVNTMQVTATPQQTAVPKAAQQDINELPLVDNVALYANDDPSSIVTIYVTVRKGNASENTNHTWEEVNNATKFFFENLENVEVDKAEVIFQIGDETGPIRGEVGFGENLPNGTIQVRGNSASTRTVKSYKIELRDRTGGWRGQNTIALNKHYGDPTRIKNYLSFDLLQSVPDMTSLRTQFVHLYVKDETSDPPSEEFVDYGLFTQVEQPNRTFLRNHGLDPNGQLYKAVFFEFFRYPQEIRPVDDPQYELRAFETRLEVKGDQNHTKLISMLEAVNDPLIPIEQTFERYFNVDNYFTWMAFNILIGHTDTTSQNFYLYSPQNSEKWYFLPWDYDASLNVLFKERFGSVFPYQNWEKGVQTYWGVVLHNRVLKVDRYRQQLDEKIEEIRPLLTSEIINEKLAVYREVTAPFLNRTPDLFYSEEDRLEFAYQTIPREVDTNYQRYQQSLKEPMPFFLGTPEIVDGKIRFYWNTSYDFNAENITYQIQLSRDYEFNEVILEATTTNFPQVEFDNVLEPDTYFWRVIARNESGYQQFPFDNYMDDLNIRHNGLQVFYVYADGTLSPQ